MAKPSTPSPIDDLTYDLVAVLHHKAQALEAWDKYIGDAQAEDDGELEDLFSQMRAQDEESVLALKEVLAHRLEEDLDYEEVDDRDTAEYDDDLGVEPDESVGSQPSPTPHGPDESSPRQR